MLAKDVNDNAGFLDKRVVLGFFASKPAPTVAGAEQGMWHFKCRPEHQPLPCSGFCIF
ncbi:MAG: hypothetical protein ACRC1I_02100 [Pseudomonas proteolytica]|uniref:hypothetical protein n=1 Tax=Pseudomonas proteolytica TaxID=219574 RepID=UPI003F2E452E